MIDCASLSDEDLMLTYYTQEDEQLANAAFAELDRRFRPRMLLTLTVPGYNRKFVKLHRMPGLEQKGEELVNEALFKVADSKGRPTARWDPSRRKLAPWIFGILRNVVVSFLRLKRPKVRVDTDLRPEDTDEGTASPLDAAADPSAGPDEEMQNQALVTLLRECLDELPDELRRLCEMLYGQRMKQNEIAAVLNVSAPTLTRRKKEACDLLQRCLRRKGVDQEVFS